MMSSNPSDSDDPLATRASLLYRLRDWRDAASWAEFYHLYRNLVIGLSMRSGLTYSEAEDVAQDVFTRVAETIHSFEANHERGTFRGWLMTLTRWRITDQFRRKAKTPGGRSFSREDRTDETSTVERVPDTKPVFTEAVEEEEWQRHILGAGLARLARRVPAKQFQAFDLYIRQHWPVTRVARELSLNVATVYVIGHRLTKQLRTEIRALQTQLG